MEKLEMWNNGERSLVVSLRNLLLRSFVWKSLFINSWGEALLIIWYSEDEDSSWRLYHEYHTLPITHCTWCGAICWGKLFFLYTHKSLFLFKKTTVEFIMTLLWKCQFNASSCWKAESVTELTSNGVEHKTQCHCCCKSYFQYCRCF